MKTPPLTRESELETLLRESAGLEDAPAHLVYRAEALWSPPRAAPTAEPGPWRRLLASLSFDSQGASGLALGLRGDESQARQWLFTSQEHDFDLRCEAGDEPPAAAWHLSGQVLGPEAPGEVLVYASSQALLSESEPPLTRAVLGELSDFRCEELPPGRYTLVFLLGSLRIELPPIEFGASPPAAA